MKDTGIKKFVLELEGKEVSLTPSQAKKLFEALNELFGKKEVEHVHHYPWTFYPYTYVSSGVTVSPTYPTTTIGWEYTASNGTQFSVSDGTMNISLLN